MSIWYFAAPFLLLAFVAIVAALASGIPEAQHEDDLYLTPEERNEPKGDRPPFGCALLVWGGDR